MRWKGIDCKGIWENVLRCWKYSVLIVVLVAWIHISNTKYKYTNSSNYFILFEIILHKYVLHKLPLYETDCKKCHTVNLQISCMGPWYLRSSEQGGITVNPVVEGISIQQMNLSSLWNVKHSQRQSRRERAFHLPFLQLFSILLERSFCLWLSHKLRPLTALVTNLQLSPITWRSKNSSVTCTVLRPGSCPPGSPFPTAFPLLPELSRSGCFQPAVLPGPGQSSSVPVFGPWSLGRQTGQKHLVRILAGEWDKFARQEFRAVKRDNESCFLDL